jgi:hypothetical protein
MIKKLAYHKWHRFPEESPLAEEYHVWGEKIGLHISWWTKEGAWGEYPHDPFDILKVSHFMRFPVGPRKSKR